ncbi:MAG: nitroreductase family protein [Desulfoprunum sp.]|jgi:nitroreductase|uniref:nitroreductase family protein n=1 Tax=Desulfoprunum sp. TaxID=2020866 RepID=UPI00052B961E|nr:nitroreductase [Desulfobulbus sp. Tol-SR]
MIAFHVDKEKCIGCGLCAADCPMGIIAMEEGLPVIPAADEARCIHCLHCFAICDPGAIAIDGHTATAQDAQHENLPSPEQMESLVRGRRAIRNYLKENLEPGLIDRMLAVAWHAPTGRNERRLLFTVVDDRQVLDRIREEALHGLSALVEQRKLPHGMEIFADIVEAWQVQKIDILFRGAPHLLVVSAPRNGISPLPDAVIALTTFELFARSLGVGTVWNGLAKIAIDDLVPSLRALIGIPEDHLIGYAMCFGRPAVRYARHAPRHPQAINRVKIAG